MLCYDPKSRFNKEQIRNHPWYKGDFWDKKELMKEMIRRNERIESENFVKNCSQKPKEISNLKTIKFR